MAAAHKTRRKTQLPKRRKQTASKKTQQRKLLPKPKKPQQKQGKHPEPPKTKGKRPYDDFVSKVLRQLNRDKVRISTKAKGKMMSFMRRFYNNLSKQAQNNKKSKNTIGSKKLEDALKRVMCKREATELVRIIRKVSGRRHH